MTYDFTKRPEWMRAVHDLSEGKVGALEVLAQIKTYTSRIELELDRAKQLNKALACWLTRTIV